MKTTLTHMGAARLAKTVSALEAARALHPELRESLDLYIAILQARQSVAAKLSLSASDPRPPNLSGLDPVPPVQSLVTDWSAFAQLFRRICLIVARHRPWQAKPFKEFAQSSLPQLQEWADAYLRNELDTRWASQPLLIGFILNNTCHPFLSASPAFAAWEMQADKDAWYRGNCPVCRGEPDFAALEKESGALRLLCSRCDAEWKFHRTICPFCGAADAGNWGYYAGGEGAYRLYVCNTCRRYLKTIDSRELARPADLAAERILTIAMDVAALNAGYSAHSSADLSPAAQIG